MAATTGRIWTRSERLVGALTIANGALGLVMWVMALLSRGAIGILPLLAVLGLLSGVLAWRGRPAGHGAALVFYGMQLAVFHSLAFDAGLPHDAGYSAWRLSCTCRPAC